MNQTDPVNVIPWVLVFIMAALLTALVTIGVRFVAGYANTVLGGIRGNLNADLDAARARTEAEAQLFANLATTFTEAMATLAKATSYYVAGDAVGNDPSKPVAPTYIDRANIVNQRIPLNTLGEDVEYVDWTEKLPGLEPEEGARARFIPPGMSPVDLIRAAARGADDAAQ